METVAIVVSGRKVCSPFLRLTALLFMCIPCVLFPVRHFLFLFFFFLIYFSFCQPLTKSPRGTNERRYPFFYLVASQSLTSFSSPASAIAGGAIRAAGRLVCEKNTVSMLHLLTLTLNNAPKSSYWSQHSSLCCPFYKSHGILRLVSVSRDSFQTGIKEGEYPA